jgi:hypothetical protein
MADDRTRITRLEAAFAREHDYVFDEGDVAKATHGRHMTPGTRLYIGETLPETTDGYNAAFITTSSTLHILASGAWVEVLGGSV